MTPLFSIVIPGHNRVEPLKYTLRSAAASARLLPPGSVEIILVDDGSTPPLVEQLAGFDPGHPVVHLRQPNQGSIVARQTGLAAATGQRVLFLDSDDLITPDKLVLHQDAARATDPDITYDDNTEATLGPDYSASFSPGRSSSLARVSTHVEFLFHVQPAPHSPIYRREYLLKALAQPLIPPDRRMDPAGDVWLYYNLAVHSARVTKLDAHLSAVGPHEQTRYSQHWEKLGVAALLVAEAFDRACPPEPAFFDARRSVGELAFISWRRLPRNYPSSYARRLLALWKKAPRSRRAVLGGRSFRFFAAILGPVAAGRLYRLVFGIPYSSCRTLDPAALSRLLSDHGIG